MKQAVVIMHGMGEQIPMTTLNSFVRSVWTTDSTLTRPGKPDPNTGGPRTGNAHWAKPDRRNSSSELRRITTERDIRDNYTDFYEYYWAHLMEGTTWEHVSAWIRDLLLRNPMTRVPGRVLHAWIVLWLITLVVIGFVLSGLWPGVNACKPWLRGILVLLGMAGSALVSAVLIKRFGDVARYVKALPPNVAKRHAIRQDGVDLLARLIDSNEYDRIVVVAHSLGAIIAYDILAQLYPRYNMTGGNAAQPERHKMEQMIRDALTGTALDIDSFQDQQARAFAEGRDQGARWNISDFVTLGAPLAHAEFLMAESHADLRARQATRLLPTCPPFLEYDNTTKMRHFTYSTLSDRRPEHFRTPHHAALFAYTRWTNLYSQEKGLLTGDLISGPVSEVFGLDGKHGVVRGVRDIAVLPALAPDGSVAIGHKRRFFTHNSYWNPSKASETNRVDPPHHIAALRRALAILQ